MVGEQEGGNETYIVNLLNALASFGGDENYWVATAHPRDLADKVHLGGKMQPFEVSNNPVVRLLYDLPLAAKRLHADLLHVTYMPPPLPLRLVLVSTVHDVIHARHPEWFSRRDRIVLHAGVRDSTRRADAVLTVSEHARSEIISLYRANPAKVHVVYNAGNETLSALNQGRRTFQARKILGAEYPYLLAVGSLNPRKNIKRLIEAFAHLKKNAAIPHKLLLVGKAHWGHTELHTVAVTSEVERDVMFTGYVDDAQLVDLYQGADVFIYPSLFEGFGIPVLEAMTCGTPVVTSNTSSIPEVAGDAALLINPEKSESISKAILNILQDRDLASTLRSKGFERAKQFSWSSSAKQIRKIYLESINRRTINRYSSVP